MLNNEDDECEIVSVTKVHSSIPGFDHINEPNSPETDDDEVELIKVERLPENKNIINHQKQALQIIINRLKQTKSDTEIASNEPEIKSDDPLNIQKYFPCSECKRIFATALDLIQHSQSHEKRSRNSLKSSRPKTKRFQCKICASEFPKQVSLAAHMNLHRSSMRNPLELTFKCKECNEMFRSNGSLWNHRKTKHLPVIFKCSTCCKTFATESAYKEHVRKHEAEGPIICDVCQKGFTLLSSLTIHMRLHTGELPYLCAECGKSFNTNSRLQEHLRRHQGLRRYECNVCMKRFYEKNDLKKHSYTHDGNPERPHTCKILPSFDTKQEFN